MQKREGSRRNTKNKLRSPHFNDHNRCDSLREKVMTKKSMKITKKLQNTQNQDKKSMNTLVNKRGLENHTQPNNVKRIVLEDKSTPLFFVVPDRCAKL